MAKLSEQADPRTAGKAAENLPANRSENGGTLAAPMDFEAFAGFGRENITAKDMLVPRLTILQALSPQLDRTKSEFIDGAAAGDICDVGTGEIYKDGVSFIAVQYRMDYLEWAPRNTRKGLINVHTDPVILDQTTKDEKKRNVLPNGNYVAETAQFFGINLSANRRRCFIPMTSTQLKKARKWNTLTDGDMLQRSDGSEYQAPMFYRVWNLTTGPESNAEGNWMGWIINQGPPIHEAELPWDWKSLLEMSIKFLRDLQGGAVKADVESMGGDVVEGEVNRDPSGRM